MTNALEKVSTKADDDVKKQVDLALKAEGAKTPEKVVKNVLG